MTTSKIRCPYRRSGVFDHEPEQIAADLVNLLTGSARFAGIYATVASSILY